MGSRFYLVLLKKEMFRKYLIGFVVHGSEVSTVKGVYWINGRRFRIVLSVAVGILFFGICCPEMGFK